MKSRKPLFIFLYFIALFALFIGGIFIFSNDYLRDGKLTLDVAVEKTKVQEKDSSVVDLASFQTYFDGYITSLNKESGDTDYYGVNSYKENDNQYIASVSTRRLDKLKGLGFFRYGKGSSFFTNNTTTADLFDEIYDGKIRNNVLRTYQDGSSVTYTFPAEVRKNNKFSVRYHDLTNESYDYTKEEITNTIAKNNSYVLYFELIDFSLIDSISFKLDGSVSGVSFLKSSAGENNNNIEVDGNSITLKPVTLYASVEGEEVKTNTFIGYIVYSQRISPILISFFVTLGVLLLTCLYFLIFEGYAKIIFSKRTLMKLWKYRAVYVILLPSLLLLVLFRYLPMIWLSSAFMEYDLLDGLQSEFIGSKYFMRIFLAQNTAEMYRIFRNTIFISFIRIVSNLPFILFLALVINSMKRKKVKTVFQSLSLIPYFLSWVAVGGLFYSLLNSESGLINRLFSITTDWYHVSEPWWALLSMSSLWKGMGWSAIIYIAGMCTIDESLYEAARIDGCGPVRQAFTVTLPGIAGVVCLQLILDISNIMKDNYDQIYAMVNGQTLGQIQETVDVVGRIAFTSLRDGNFGSATAIGLIQGVIGCILVIIANRIVKKSDNEGII